VARASSWIGRYGHAPTLFEQRSKPVHKTAAGDAESS
jgi:hypothetical protein